MLITMLADRFEAGGVLRAKGTQVDVATDLALRWIGDGVASAVGTSRESAQGLRKDVAVVQDQVTGQQYAGPSAVSGAGTPDLVVFGANPGGLMAAIAAKRRGAKVVVLEPSQWIGGMLTGGLSATDINKGDPSVQVNGLAREFFVRVAAELGQRDETFWRNGYAAEPRIFQTVLGRMLGEAGITVVTGAQLTGVSKTGTRITSISTTAGSYSGTTYVDATYEGDLIAAAGCSTSLGREANTLYTETYNGIRPPGTSAQFDPSVSPYRTAGVAGSGLLPGFSTASLGTTGNAEASVMAMTYRLCVAKTGSNRRGQFAAPSDYDPLNYEALGRHIAAVGSGWTTLDGQALVLQLQNRSGLSNCWDWNNGSYPMGINYVDPICTEYITTSVNGVPNYARRAQIAQIIRNYEQGWFYFMRTDSRVPSAVRTDAGNWQLMSDQFEAYSGWSPVLYVREGRRLVGDVVGKQDDALNAQTYTDGVASMYYALDSHHVRRIDNAGVATNEGYIFGVTINSNCNPVRFAWMKPKVAECTNLLSTFALSISRVLFLTLRMEPISMGCGEAAGIAAVIAAQRGIDVSSVTASEVLALQNRFALQTPGGAILGAQSESPFNGGTVTTAGTWNDATAGTCFDLPKHSASTDYATPATKRFAPNLGATGAYDVYVYFPVRDTSIRSPATEVIVSHAGGTTTLTLDQNNGKDGGNWQCIGRYTFQRGTPSANYVQVKAITGGANGSVIGAVKWLPAATN